jgi:succinate dehydrogenase (ubiquinone) flavoprotein subunit
MLFPRLTRAALPTSSAVAAAPALRRSLHASRAVAKIVASQPLRAKEAAQPHDAVKGYPIIEHE